jgi:hypothetical protein
VTEEGREGVGGRVARAHGVFLLLAQEACWLPHGAPLRVWAGLPVFVLLLRARGSDQIRSLSTRARGGWVRVPCICLSSGTPKRGRTAWAPGARGTHGGARARERRTRRQHLANGPQRAGCLRGLLPREQK